MHLILVKTMANLTITSAHTISQIVIKDTMVEVTINSYVELGGSVIWQHTLTAPMEAVGTDPMTTVAEFLTAPGGYLEGGSIQIDPTPLEVLRATMTSRVNYIRDQHIYGNAETPAGVVNTDEVSIRNITGGGQAALGALLAGANFSISWRLADDTNVQLDAAGMVTLANAVMTHTSECYAKSWALKALIVEAATIEELQAIDLTSGWDTNTDIEQPE